MKLNIGLKKATDNETKITFHNPLNIFVFISSSLLFLNLDIIIVHTILNVLFIIQGIKTQNQKRLFYFMAKCGLAYKV